MSAYIVSVVLGTIRGLKRTCPKCRKDQIVPASKKQETVLCKFCGAKIPPKQTPR